MKKFRFLTLLTSAALSLAPLSSINCFAEDASYSFNISFVTEEKGEYVNNVKAELIQRTVKWMDDEHYTFVDEGKVISEWSTSDTNPFITENITDDWKDHVYSIVVDELPDGYTYNSGKSVEQGISGFLDGEVKVIVKLDEGEIPDNTTPLNGTYSLRLDVKDIVRNEKVSDLDCELFNIQTGDVVAKWNTADTEELYVEGLQYSFDKPDSYNGNITYAIRITNLPEKYRFFYGKTREQYGVSGFSLKEFENGTELKCTAYLEDTSEDAPKYTYVTTPQGVTTASTVTTTTSVAGNAEGTKKLISDRDIISLSKKGDALTWSDFEKYEHTDIGDGSYIWEFAIKNFSPNTKLLVCGSSLKEKPEQIKLIMGTGAEVDVRKDDLTGWFYDDGPSDVSAFDIIFKDALEIENGTEKAFEYEINGTDEVSFMSDSSGITLDNSFENGKGTLTVKAKGALEGNNFIKCFLGTGENSITKTITLTVNKPTTFHCPECGRDVPIEDKVSGAMRSVCKDCYEKGQNIGTTISPETKSLISDPETITAMLKAFIKEKNLPSAKVFEDALSGTVTISYYHVHPEQKEMFENFISDNNIDADKVFFLVMVGDENERIKLISDHETIITMLKDFIKENNLPSATVFDDELTGTVAISYYYVYPEQKKLFEDFIKNSNIKEDEVSFMVMEGATEIPDKKATATLKGDVDLNGMVDLADLTSLAKYILSKEAYPLANETAYANADMNDDGVVDILDTSALIEQQLGK